MGDLDDRRRSSNLIMAVHAARKQSSTILWPDQPDDAKKTSKFDKFRSNMSQSADLLDQHAGRKQSSTIGLPDQSNDAKKFSKLDKIRLNMTQSADALG
jgi:hypothetical protein